MKRITNSFIKNIVRQSLNESYGLLNEQVPVYSYTLTNKYRMDGYIVAKGTVVQNLTIPECPDGGFCYSVIEAAKKLREINSNKNLIIAGCGNVPQKGLPTLTSAQITDIGTLLLNELSENLVNHTTVKDQIEKLTDWPTFCKAYNNSKKSSGRELGFIGTSEGDPDYGIENLYDPDKTNAYAYIATLFDNSIEITEQGVDAWKKDLAKNIKIIVDKQKEIDAAAAQKEVDDAANTAKIGGAGETETWLTDHPALGVQRQIKTSTGNGIVHTLNTDDPTINKFSYGYIVRNDNQTIQPIKVRNDDETNPLEIDPKTDVNFQYALSKTDTWKYNDVIVSDNFIALTTDPKFENPFVQESYRHKGFRYNLLTEIELKYDKKKPQTGVEVGNIQKKLQLPADTGTPTFGTKTLAAVIKHQTEKKLKRTDGVVDDETYASIMALEDPAFELSVAKKSKGDDVTLVQKKLGAKVGTFTIDTENAVKAFQEKEKDKVTPPLIRTDGVVDQATFNQIKKYKGYNYSGAKTNYIKGDWIYIKARKGGNEGGIFGDQYYKIKSVSDDRQTVVLDLGVGITSLTAADYDVDHVGGVTAKVLFGRNAEGETKETPIVGSDNETEGGETERGTGKRLPTGSGGGGTTTTIDPEKQRQRDIRKKEFCDTLRQIKQYLNNTKNANLTVNCQSTPETKNQIMLALTGGTPAPTQDTGVNVQPESPTNQFL